jgi:transposase-like protein
VRTGQTRLDGFNERIIALYARGVTTRDIRAHLREMYDVDVSPDLISRVTDVVVKRLAEWQARPGPAVGESAKFWLTVLSELKSRGAAWSTMPPRARARAGVAGFIDEYHRDRRRHSSIG